MPLRKTENPITNIFQISIRTHNTHTYTHCAHTHARTHTRTHTCTQGWVWLGHQTTPPLTGHGELLSLFGRVAALWTPDRLALQVLHPLPPNMIVTVANLCMCEEVRRAHRRVWLLSTRTYPVGLEIFMDMNFLRFSRLVHP